MLTNIAVRKNLEELQLLNNCRGEISTLLTGAAANISTLILCRINLKTSFKTPFSKLKNLKVNSCSGDISSLFTQTAPYISSLELYHIDMKNWQYALRTGGDNNSLIYSQDGIHQ